MNFRSRANEAEAVVREIRSAGGRAIAVGADVSGRRRRYGSLRSAPRASSAQSTF